VIGYNQDAMTSRERIYAAFNHKETDLIPIDFSGHRSSGIGALIYSDLRKHLKLPPKPVRVYDMIQQLAVVDEDVLDRFGVDTVEMGRGFLTEKEAWKDWVLPDGTPCKIPHYIPIQKQGNDWFLLNSKGKKLAVLKKGSLYFEQIYFPLEDRDFAADGFNDLEGALTQTVWTDVASPGAHLPLNEKGLAEMALKARKFRSSTDRAVIGLFGGNMFEIPQMLFRMDHYLMYLSLYPKKALKFSEKLCALHIKNLEKWLGAVGPYIDIILFGDDLGGQSGPLISPRMYRDMIKPFHKKLWMRAKELADVKVMLHCCGSVRELMEDLIDAGLDAINPVQITASGMEPGGLKKDFGDRITFWGGGCDTRDVLPHSSPEQVAAHVREQVDRLRPKGGFVFQQVHNILADVPAENVAAMFDAINKP
jgi:uroporphyrinogen decarboxylase